MAVEEISSTAVGRYDLFGVIAPHADQMRILTGIHAEGYAAEHASEHEEAAAPQIGHSSGSFERDCLGLAPAVGTG
jgi:hypothetical protein